MTAEERIFACKRFLPEKAERFGFKRRGDRLVYETKILGGDFSVRLCVYDNGEFDCRVIDEMNGEDYALLRVESFDGSYVGEVRASYERLLTKIAETCCVDMPFVSGQANRICLLIKERFGVSPDYPFDEKPPKSGVFRHKDNNKWFALVMHIRESKLLPADSERRIDVVNLKATEATVAHADGTAGVFPAYHMSRKSWISVALDERLSDEEVMRLVSESFALTEKKDKRDKKR